MTSINHFKPTRTVMTAQEVFDVAVNGVLAQGRPSVDGRGICKYRGRGVKCAAGHVLKDAHYDKLTWDSETHDSSLSAIVERGDAPDYMFAHQSLLERLQAAHDDKAQFADDATGLEMWLMDFRIKARKIAKDRKLRMPVALHKKNDAKVAA